MKSTNQFFDSQRQAQIHSFKGWVCNRGLAVRQNSTKEIVCLCPPSFYGRWCEYMSDRLTVIVRFEDTTHTLQYPLKILATLSTTMNDTVLAYHQFHFTPALHDFEKKHRFYLVYPRPRHLSNNQYGHRIRFEAYHLFPNGTLGILAVWQYPIRFDFLPVQRLAKVLRYSSSRRMDDRKHTCFSSTRNLCLNGGQCHPLANTNDNTAYWCQCSNMTAGVHCERWAHSYHV